jgi:uncharacterized protein
VTVELRPLGVLCNLQCTYCYQEPIREAGNVRRQYDIEAMKRAIEEDGGSFVLFGGEPLLVPIDDLAQLFAWGLEKFGRNGVQTNGSLITPAHIELFRRYKVGVGISIDGPDELNDLRVSGSRQRTREATARTQANIAALLDAGIEPGLIVTLHRGNTGARLPRLIAWMADLERAGITSIRLHLLESESPTIRSLYGLSDEENIATLLALLKFETTLRDLRFDIFSEMRDMLMGRDQQSSCVWNGCDPYTTPAVRGVEGFGQRSNCGRTNKEGVDFVRAERPGHERYLALYHTPQAAGGCQDCRFFLACKGHCPGTAIDGEMRHRTEHCAIWMALLEKIEGDLIERNIVPVSISPMRRRLEAYFIRAWSDGTAPRLSALMPRTRDTGWRQQVRALADDLRA